MVSRLLVYIYYILTDHAFAMMKIGSDETFQLICVYVRNLDFMELFVLPTMQRLPSTEKGNLRTVYRMAPIDI